MGPDDENEQMLRNAYNNCLKILADNGGDTIAFPAISTGNNKYPKEPAAQIAVQCVRDGLQKYRKITKVIFCVNNAHMYNIYAKLLS